MSDAAEAILDAAGRNVIAVGFHATTVDAVARDAGVSRATVYRVFPGGRADILDGFLAREVERFFSDLYDHVRDLDDLESVLVEGLTYARSRIIAHPVLNVALVEDSSVLESTFSKTIESITATIAEFVTSYLPTSPHRAERGDFLARMALSYLSAPGAWDFADPAQVEALVRSELIPSVSSGKRVSKVRPTPLPKAENTTLQQRVARALQKEFVSGHSLSMESVARSAEVSRATLYRAFPGGRWQLVGATVEIETARILSAVAAGLNDARSLDDAVVGALTTIWHHAATHPSLNRLLDVRPDLIHDQMRFAKAQRNFEVFTAQMAPLLARWVGREASERVAEWTLRVMFSYWLDPAPSLDVTDPASIASFYNRHLAAGVDALAALPDQRRAVAVLGKRH